MLSLCLNYFVKLVSQLSALRELPVRFSESKDNAKLISPYDSLESEARVRKRADALSQPGK